MIHPIAEYNKGATIEIKIGEHTFVTPPMPDKKDILFHGLPKRDQYWRRQTDFPRTFYEWHQDSHSLGDGVELDAEYTKHHPETGILTALSVEDTITLFGEISKGEPEGLQVRELRRCAEGVWFFNNGEPTYITGDHYFIMQWGAMLGGTNYVEKGSNYGQYYQFQRDMGYYYEICRTTPYGRGGIYMKPKKTGATQYYSLLCLNVAMRHAQSNIRIMSITETLAKDSNFGYIKYAVQKMPTILLPSRAKQNEGEIVFGAANSARNPLSKKKRRMEAEPLNTWLCTVPTSRTSFDSLTNLIALIDEWPKIKDSTCPRDLVAATLPTVMEGMAVRKGTIFMMSYSPEKSNESFYQAREIYKNSKLKTRQKHPETGEYYGQTNSKLICHTLTIQEGIFGGCDIYGKPIEKKIWELIQMEIDDATRQENSAEKIQIIKRQYPANENDPWQEGSVEDCVFDNIRISQRVMDLEEDASIGVLPYVDFNFKYEKMPVKRDIGTEYSFPGRIIMDKLTDERRRNGERKGKWRWYRPEFTPEWFMAKYVNKRIEDQKTGLLAPDPNSPFFISIDPTNYRSKKYTGVGSFNAIMCFLMPNAELDTAVGNRVSNRRLFMEYLYREENPIDTMHAFIQVILYLNCPVLIEGNVPTWTEKLIEMGLGNYLLMMNHETKAIEPWSRHKKQILFTSQTATIDLYVNAGKAHLAEPTLPHEIDNIQYLDSEIVLTQLARFKVEDTKEYDAAVAYLEGLMGIEAIMGWRRQQEERSARKLHKGMPIATSGLLR